VIILIPNFEYMAMLSDDEYMFLIKEPPKWKVVHWNDKTGNTIEKACKTDARMLRYVRRKSGKIPIVPTMELKALKKLSWNNSEDDFILFGKKDTP
tara:strand:+ start:1087 stop:1374 length:288 start_codon:yes stop_codon:yes gene_type:complete